MRKKRKQSSPALPEVNSPQAKEIALGGYDLRMRAENLRAAYVTFQQCLAEAHEAGLETFWYEFTELGKGQATPRPNVGLGPEIQIIRSLHWGLEL